MKGIRKPLDICFWLGLIIAGVGLAWAFRPTPYSDSRYFPRVRNAAFRRGPSVLFDEAHWNGASVHGNYQPFVQLLGRDGYRVYRNKQEFVPELLASYDNLVIVEPLGFRGQPFTAAEVKVVTQWVKDGGNLLLVAGSSSAQLLAASFGVRMHAEPVATNEPTIMDHPITRGRPEREEDLRRIVFFGGQMLSGPQPILGNQCVAIGFGTGRLAIVGDPLALTAQRINGQRRGINNADFDNGQLVLNIMHWLSRLI